MQEYSGKKERNLHILKLRSDGLTHKEIGEVCGVSRRTIGRVLDGYQYEKTHRKELSDYMRKYRKNNPDKFKQYEQNRPKSRIEYMREYHRKWRLQNIEKEQIRARKKYHDNKESYFNNTRKRRALKQRAFLGYIPKKLIEILYALQNQICDICGEDLSLDEHFEIDHKIPITSARSIECICNLQLTHRICNRQKLGKIQERYEDLNQLSLQLEEIRRSSEW